MEITMAYIYAPSSQQGSKGDPLRHFGAVSNKSLTTNATAYEEIHENLVDASSPAIKREQRHPTFQVKSSIWLNQNYAYAAVAVHLR
jgi:hypothetical protein